MSTIQDEAFNGTLTAASLDSDSNMSMIDREGGNINLTPLAAACSGGHLDTVKLLISRKANPNARSPHNLTPLYFVTSRNSHPKNRAAIVQALIDSGADVNLPCDEDRNTPLMNAIVEIRDDKGVVHLLVDNNASTTQVNRHNKNAKMLADQYKMARHLRSKAERSSTRASIVDIVVSLVLLVISYVNSSLVKTVAGGVVNQLYKIRGATDANLAKEIPEPKTTTEFKNNLNNYVKGKTFVKFFAPDDPFLQRLAENASALAADDSTDFSKPENIKRLTRLSLYETIIYCDDSGSMKGSRWAIQKELVTRIARIATKIVPEDAAGVQLHFINAPSPSTLLKDAKELEQAIDKVEPNYGTRIGTNLHSKILEPVYSCISKATITNPIPLKRPILVCTITDGSPGSEKTNTFENMIVECKMKLTEAGYDPTAVMFCVSQLGNDEKAAQFLDGLRNNPRLKEVLYITADRLDEKFQGLAANERQLDSWLLHLLTKPIMEGMEK